jgi:hypothetical protein
MVICLNPSKESCSSTNVNNRIRSTECIEEILNNEMEDEAEFLIDNFHRIKNCSIHLYQESMKLIKLFAASKIRNAF